MKTIKAEDVVVLNPKFAIGTKVYFLMNNKPVETEIYSFRILVHLETEEPFIPMPKILVWFHTITKKTFDKRYVYNWCYYVSYKENNIPLTLEMVEGENGYFIDGGKTRVFFEKEDLLNHIKTQLS